MAFKHGAYYHLACGKWTPLGKEYGPALLKHAEIEGASRQAPRNVAALLTEYINTAKIAPETKRGYLNSAKRLGDAFGTERPDMLKREHLFRYVFDKGTVAANRDRALVSAAYTHAANVGYPWANPARGWQRRAPEKARKRYITDAELKALVAHAGPLGPMIRLAYLTGADLGVLRSLRLSAASKEGLSIKRTKTEGEALVSWSKALRGVWREIAGGRTEGLAFTVRNVRRLWDAAREGAGLPDVQFRDLRRKAGSDASSDEHASKLLAHAGTAVTRKHYRARRVPVKPVR